jgi:hypothetical protein
MSLWGVAIYVASVVAILGLLILAASRSVRLLRSVRRGETVLSEGETLGAVLVVLIIGLLIVGAVVGLLALASSV